MQKYENLLIEEIKGWNSPSVSAMMLDKVIWGLDVAENLASDELAISIIAAESRK